MKKVDPLEAFRKWGRQGGKRRAAKYTPDELSAIAKKGVRTRKKRQDMEPL